MNYEVNPEYWYPIETAPADGKCLLAIDTDDGWVYGVLFRDSEGNWIHEGEPTFCHGYYFHPAYWTDKIPALPANEPNRGDD